MVRQIVRIGSTLLVGAGCAATAAGLIARRVPVSNHVVLTFAAFAPYLALGAAAAALALLLRRRRVAAVAATAMAAIAALVEMPLFTGTDGVPTGSVPLRVLTANLRTGDADPHSLVALARDRADLLVFEELTPALAQRLSAEGMDTEFPYRVLAPRAEASGTGIWSRYPITRSEPVAGFELATLRAHLAVPGTSASALVLAVHLVGPWPQPIDGWRQEIAAMSTAMDDTVAMAGGGAVVVAGDFNATYDMLPFRNLLRAGFRDAAEQSGAGLLPTFPADSHVPPLIGIDHVVTHSSTVSNAETVRVAGSDHLGLVTTVDLPTT